MAGYWVDQGLDHLWLYYKNSLAWLDFYFGAGRLSLAESDNRSPCAKNRVWPVTRNRTPHFWFPVQIYRNIWTPRIIYFNFAEIFGPPGTKISEIFGPS